MISLVHVTRIHRTDSATRPHRDEGYVLIFQREGCLTLMVDQDLVEMKGGSVYFILPGQLYHVLPSADTNSWMMFVNSALLQLEVRSKLNEWYYGKDPVLLSAKKVGRFLGVMTFLLEELTESIYPLNRALVRRGLVDVISGMVAEEYANPSSLPSGDSSRNAAITADFRQLLLNNFKTMRKPSEYAAALHLSTAYLNQAVKATSGYTVSYWIQKMLINEAKILLSTTNKPIKDISYELGYCDQAYFSRLFSRSQKISPQAFRVMMQGGSNSV